MIYHGAILSMTYYWQPGGSIRHGYRPRYGFVTDDNGFPFDMPTAVKLVDLIAQGWEKIGTWPVAQHPKDLWAVACWHGSEAWA